MLVFCLVHHIRKWLTREQTRAGAAPHLKMNVESSATTVRLAAAIPMMYAAIANLEVFDSPESTALLAPGNSEVKPGTLDSSIATRSNENDRVGVEQLE